MPETREQRLHAFPQKELVKIIRSATTMNAVVALAPKFETFNAEEHDMFEPIVVYQYTLHELVLELCRRTEKLVPEPVFTIEPWQNEAILKMNGRIIGACPNTHEGREELGYRIERMKHALLHG